MEHRFSVFFLTAIALLAAVGPGISQGLPETVRRDLRGLQTGMVTATFSGDSLTSLEAYGTQTPRRETPVSPDQIIPFPALSEVIVGMTVEGLFAAEALDPDAPISRYLPGLSSALGRATLHQLLSHTGGLDDARVRSGQTWEDALNELSDWALVTEPGFIFSRSRYSFPLAVRIIERATGQPFSEFATEAVLAPLGLEGTTFDLEEARSSGLIDGLTLSTRPGTPFTLVPGQSTVRGLPVVFTTTREAVQLLSAWMAGRLSGDVPWDAQADGSVSNDVGFRSGVVVDEFQGQVRVSRTASDLGFGTGIRFFPGLGRGLLAWATAGPPRLTIDAAEEQLLAEFLPGSIDRQGESPGLPEDGPPPDPTPIPFHESGWAGEYRNGDEMFELRQNGGNLTFFTGTGELGVQPGPDGVMTVVLDDGRATDISFRLVLDAKNRRYLLRGDSTNPKAFLNEQDRNW